APATRGGGPPRVDTSPGGAGRLVHGAGATASRAPAPWHRRAGPGSTPEAVALALQRWLPGGVAGGRAWEANRAAVPGRGGCGRVPARGRGSAGRTTRDSARGIATSGAPGRVASPG